MNTRRQSRSASSGATAVVVGLCSHGLAAVRALAGRGVEVHALESDETLPGVYTRYARIHHVPAINDARLIDSLLEIHDAVQGVSGERPVLLLMNDNMVLEVARNWGRLESCYRLGWHDSRETIARLMIKSALEAYCRDKGLRYPQTWTLNAPADIDRLTEIIVYPVVVKPVKPLGGFKVRIVHDSDELRSIARDYSADLPLLVQQWVSGGDSSLYFCAFYFDRGREVASFCGRKMLSHPPAHGQTTAAEPFFDEEVYHQSQQFFHGSRISGPASLELKRDDLGRLWVIEPTLGRTDFWLGLCVANGINIPYIEYCEVTGQAYKPPQPETNTCWFDTERDPTIFVRFAKERGFLHMWKNSTFSYLDAGDLKPFLVAFRKMLFEKGRNALRKITAGKG